MWYCHPDAVKLCNACNLVFLIDSTYKTNRYQLPLLDFVGVTPTGMTFSVGFSYLEGERLFLRRDALPGVLVTDRDLALMNSVKTVFPECANLLCRFHIDKNVKEKCKSLIGQKNIWDYVMDAWGSLVDCPSEHQFDYCLKKFEIACSPWPMFVGYVNETWIISQKEKFVTAWTNKVMHLGNTTINRYENVQCLGCHEQHDHATTLKLKHPLKQLHMWLDMFLKLPYTRGFLAWFQEKVNTKGAQKKPMLMEETKDQQSMICLTEYVDALHSVQNTNSSSFIHDFIDNIVDVKAEGNHGYRAISALLGIGEDSWSLVCNHLLKELRKWSDDYIKLFGGIDRFEELRRSLFVDGLSMVTMDKWMDITEMRYVIASRYNVILVSLLLQQSMAYFPLRSQPPTDSSVHRIICIGHVYGYHFAQIDSR
ncbi:hypothetical protein HKD37_08G023052 [Glycine soja]